MLKKKISAISKIRNTTKTVIQGIINENNIQYIFIDTPGVTLKTKNSIYKKKAFGVAKNSDVIIYIVDTNIKNQQYNHDLIKKLSDFNKKIILIFSKVDMIKDKKTLLPLIKDFSSFLNVTEILPLNLIKDEYQKKLINILNKFAKTNERLYDVSKNVTSDQTLFQHLEELIKEALFLVYKQEIPHKMKIKIVSFKNSNLNFYLLSTNKSQKKLLIGLKGNNLKKLRNHIINLSKQYQVNIKTLQMKVL